MTTITDLICVLILTSAIVTAGAAPAQDAPPPTDVASEDRQEASGQEGEDGAEDIGTGQDEAQDDAPPSLDDLLGLEEEESESSAAEAAEESTEAELDRELREVKIADAFVDAVNKMTIAADLLEGQFDPGLGTQRIQEEILARLDELIDLANEQQSSSSSSSSSSSQQQQQQSQQQQNNQQNQQNQQGQGQQNQQGENRGETDPPAQQSAVQGGAIDETRIEWGSLPERIREQMQQGSNDQRSALYRALTDAYYKRLAEEASK